MIKKNMLISGLLILLLFQTIQFTRGYHDPRPYVSGSDFTILLDAGSSLAFQGRDSLQIEVLSGLWNSSNNSVLTYNSRGRIIFIALNDSVLEVSSPDAEAGFNIDIQGATSSTFEGDFTYNVVVTTGDQVNIFWMWRIESWVDKYTMLTIGVGGLILMVASPSWVAWQLRKGGINPEDFKRMMYGLLLFCVGFGLLVMWLWSG